MTLRCGKCLADFDSYLKLQFHKAKQHGEKNQMSKYASVKNYHQSNNNQKEKLALAEERLKEEISRYRYYHN